MLPVLSMIGLATAGLMTPEDTAVHIPDGQALVADGAVLVSAAKAFAPGIRMTWGIRLDPSDRALTLLGWVSKAVRGKVQRRETERNKTDRNLEMQRDKKNS